MSEQRRAVTVWFDTDRTRWFAIPDDVEVLPGGLFLRSSRGAHQAVDADAVATWEIPKDEAVRLMKEELEESARRVKSSVSELFGGARPDEANQGERVMRSLGRVVGSAFSVLQETLTNPAAAEELRSRTGQLREEVERGAEKVEPTVKEVGDRLNDLLSSPQVAGAIDQLGRGLQDLARSLQRGVERPAPPAEAPPAEAPPADAGAASSDPE